jgi:uncharacterized protein (TIGR03067 family)
MKPLLLAALAMSGLLSAPFLACGADAEVDKLQGKWTVESFEYNGGPVAEMLGALREFSGDKYTLSPKTGETFSGTFKIDAAQTPKQIDLMLPDRTLKGIYEISGETLKIAYSLDGEARPTEFQSKPNSGLVLAVHKKQ